MVADASSDALTYRQNAYWAVLTGSWKSISCVAASPFSHFQISLFLALSIASFLITNWFFCAVMQLSGVCGQPPVKQRSLGSLQVWPPLHGEPDDTQLPAVHVSVPLQNRLSSQDVPSSSK